MGGLKKVPSEGGSGGRRGHSGMDHWATTHEMKVAARTVRRLDDRSVAVEELEELSDTAAIPVAVRVLGAGGIGQDRAEAVPLPHGWLLILADGAGGASGGAEAADYVVDSVRLASPSERMWAAVLGALDGKMGAERGLGETTAVAVLVSDGQVLGASVGDSGAWLVDESNVVDLTCRQHRKPLLGSGHATPVAFGPVRFRGRVIIASDGLFKYVDDSSIQRFAMLSSVDAAADALVEAARLGNGALRDDIAVIVAG